MRRRTHIAAIALIVMLLPVLAVRHARGEDASIEYEVKAAFLYNFAKFVEWPSTAFATADAPLVFCIQGRDPFGGRLERVVNDRTANARRIEVRKQLAGAPVDGCHLVFVPESEERSVARLLQPVELAQEAPVLTVGESGRFAEAGGMIRLLVEEGRVRFDINAGVAERAGLRLSSQLLKLARHVEK